MAKPQTPISLTAAELLRLRMRAQLLTGPEKTAVVDQHDSTGAAQIADVARHMLAIQGQDWLASRWALGVRAPGTNVDDVYAAFNQGRIVRSWPMRGTVHIVAAEDIGWIQSVTAPRVLRGAVKRRDFLGLSEPTLDRIVEVSLAALAGGAQLTRDELASIWTEAGIEWQSSWRYHLIWWMCQNGLTTFGPIREDGGEPLIVLTEHWIHSPRSLEGDVALCELASRYAGARGPVTVKDFAWWTGLTVGDSKRGLALAEESGALIQVEPKVSEDIPAGPYWIAADAIDEELDSWDTETRPTNAEPEWLLLPAFDEHLVGYTERRPQLDPAHFSRIVPGRNGVFRATLVADGMTRATWRHERAHSGHVLATPLPGAIINPVVIESVIERWAKFHRLSASSIKLEARE